MPVIRCLGKNNMSSPQRTLRVFIQQGLQTPQYSWMYYNGSCKDI